MHIWRLEPLLEMNWKRATDVTLSHVELKIVSNRCDIMNVALGAI